MQAKLSESIKKQLWDSGLTLKENGDICLKSDSKQFHGLIFYYGNTVETLYANGFVVLGEYAYLGAEARITHTFIGRYCSIGQNVVIGLGSHPQHWVSTHPFPYQNPLKVLGGQVEAFSLAYKHDPEITTIENDVWIGDEVVIVGGVKIGTGAVVAAGSVVTKDVPPYTVVAGNPAKAVKQRHDEVTAAALLESSWWNYDFPLIFANGVVVPWEDPLVFCEWIRKWETKLPVLSHAKKRLVREAGEYRLQVDAL